MDHIATPPQLSLIAALACCSACTPHPGLEDEALKAALRADHDHKPMSYQRARTALFVKVARFGDTITCAYTGERVKAGGQVRPPSMNTEHVWPRSKGSGRAPIVADLHHLLAIDAHTNRVRAALDFGQVRSPTWERGGAARGRDARGREVFMPRASHRGDVARAMFYVATIYELPIDADQEAVLRRWHRRDPPSLLEWIRHRRVQGLQRSRNPFVEHPSLVRRIHDF